MVVQRYTDASIVTAAQPGTVPVAYRSLWLSTLIDGLGTGATYAALPLIVAASGGGPGQVSLVAAAGSLPVLVFSLPLGVLVDRADRRRLMRRAQCASAVLSALLAVIAGLGVVASAGGVAAVCLLQVGLGTAQIAFTNAGQSVLPALLAPAALPRANARLSIASTMSEAFLGPPLGSALFALAVALPFGLDAVSFLGSAILLGQLPPTPRDAPSDRSVRADITEGLAWLWASPRLRTLALVLGANSFANQLAGSTLVLLVTRSYHAAPAAFGLLTTAGAVGAMVGAVLAGRLLSTLVPGRVVIAVLGTTTAAYLLVGVAPNLLVLGALYAVIGAGVTVWNVATVTLRQTAVPPELFGRVNSVYRLLGWGLMPVGALAGGLVAAHLGLRAPFPVAGVVRAVALVAALPVLLSWRSDDSPHLARVTVDDDLQAPRVSLFASARGTSSAQGCGVRRGGPGREPAAR